MSDSVLFGLIAVVLTVLATMLMAAETAISTITKSRAARMVDDGDRGAVKLMQIVTDPAPVLNTSRFLRIICEVTTTVIFTILTFGWFEQQWQEILVAAGGMVLIAFIFWGVAPQTLGLQKPEGIARSSAGVLLFLATILGGLPQILIVIGNVVTPGKGFADGPFGSEAELRELVDMAEASDLIEHDEREMIHSVFELGDTIVREVMVPRTDVVFIEADKTLRQGLSLALRSGFSRIPVVEDSLDNVVGVLYIKDVMKRTYDNPDAGKQETVAKLMRPAAFCPDSKPVDDLLREMQVSRHHLNIVVDEFGGAAGLVTIEDIVEEIVGEITDEYDAEPELAQEIEPGVWRVSVRTPIDDLGDLFELELDDEEVDTVGGLLAKQLNMVPIEGSCTVYSGLKITAEKPTSRRHRVNFVVVQLAPEEEMAEEEDK